MVTRGLYAYTEALPLDDHWDHLKPEFQSEGEKVACFLKKEKGRWRLLGYMGDAHEGVSAEYAYLVDGSRLAATGFPLSLIRAAKGSHWLAGEFPRYGPIYAIYRKARKR